MSIQPSSQRTGPQRTVSGRSDHDDPHNEAVNSPSRSLAVWRSGPDSDDPGNTFTSSVIWQHSRMAFEPGSRSRQTSTFMLAADVDAFSLALAPAIAGIAHWRTEFRGGKPGALAYGSLSEALVGDSVQAFLQLKGDGWGTVGPEIQYLPTSFAADPFGPYVPADSPKAVMRSGRLAFKWRPAEEPATLQARFEELAGIAWHALYTVAKPHLVSLSGRPVRRTRIGAEAKKWAIEHPSQRLSDWGTILRVL